MQFSIKISTMAKTIDRLILFIKELGVSARQFDISIGTANGYILRMHKNNASVGSDVIEKIISIYPQINLVWLITGKGDMFLDKASTKDQDIDMAALERLVAKSVDEKLASESSKLRQQLLEDIDREIEEAKQNLKN